MISTQNTITLMTNNPTLYDDMNVSNTASSDEIRLQFKKLVMRYFFHSFGKDRRYHPDKLAHIPNISDSEKEVVKSKFLNIQRAFEILGDQEKRDAYDLELEKLNILPAYSLLQSSELISSRNNPNSRYLFRV